MKFKCLNDKLKFYYLKIDLKFKIENLELL